MTKTNENNSFNQADLDYSERTRENEPSHFFESKTKFSLWKNVKTKPNLIVSCLLCEQQFPVKYNALKKQYSQKNNWGYWTENPRQQKNYLCNNCLVKLHHGNMRDWISNPNKADNFYNYFYQGKFGKKIK